MCVCVRVCACACACACACDRRGTKVAVSMGEAAKSAFFPKCQKKLSCHLAWQAWHFVTFDVFQEECVCAQPSWQ